MTEFGAAVRAGLGKTGQKELPSQYLYDELGSALFEAITVLPEYGLTRADERVLRKYSGEIADTAAATLIAELGSGTGRKTRYILRELKARHKALRYCPVDVSRSALDRCGTELADVADVVPMEDSYFEGMRRVGALRGPNERILVLFLGSTIGNFDRRCAEEFLSILREELRTGDYLLLGADLQKPEEQILAAYDDPTGVTAAFNLNVLGRINRELGGNFALRRFEHVARYDTRHHRVEMHLRARVEQTVTIPAAELQVAFAPGETIWTESSHKYHVDELAQMAGRSGFRIERQWIDREWPFSESLWQAI